MKLRNIPSGLAVAALVAGSVAVLSPSATAVSAAPVAAPVAAAKPDKTSKKEAARVDKIKTPKLDWYACYDAGTQCATTKVPLDYDKPKGAKVEIALLRVKAANKKKRIGSLFVNPGGPSGSATELASEASFFLGQDILDRFDIVGMDPRGVAFSDNVKCFTPKTQGPAIAGLSDVGYLPITKAEQKAAVKSSINIGKACSTKGKPLSGSMSTAQVARDMELMRRAVGDKKLTYLGFSYGTFLGETYANLYPDRVRAIAIDGVLNPVSWTGTKKTGKLNQDERLHSADGAYRALHEMLVRCGTAGPTKCAFSKYGDPVANYDTLAQRLKKTPLDAGTADEYGYSAFVNDTLGALYSPDGSFFIDLIATSAWEATTPATPAAAKAAAQRVRKTSDTIQKELADNPVSGRRGFPYDNSLDAFSAVTCTDGLHPADAATWPAQAAKADKRAKYFGALWAWSTSQCATKSWTVKDEDAYRGPFTKKTSAPVLVVGSNWDPATNYDEAVSTSKLMPGSRLLSSSNWGHTAYGTSDCVTSAMDAYLVSVKLPAKGTKCVGDDQPFTDVLDPGDTGEAADGLARPQIVAPLQVENGVSPRR